MLVAKDPSCVLSFRCNPITARFCWLARTLTHVSPKLVFRFTPSTEQHLSLWTLQIIQIPTLFNKLHEWCDAGPVRLNGLVDFQVSNNSSSTIAWNLNVKDLAEIVSRHCDTWNKMLRFTFINSHRLIIDIERTKEENENNDNESSSYEDFGEFEQGRISPSTAFLEQYSLAVEWVDAKIANDLGEPRVPKPEHFLRPSVDLDALLAHLRFYNSLLSFDKSKTIKRTKTLLEEDSFYDDNEQPVIVINKKTKASIELSIDIEGKSLRVAAYCLNQSPGSEAQVTFSDPSMHMMPTKDHSLAHESEQIGAKCIILIEPLIKAIRTLQELTSSVSLGASTSTAVLAIIPNHALMLYIPLTPQPGSVALYIPALL